MNTSRLNAICPYYTMFPIEFPLKHLNDVPKGRWVFDPFCGRGTTNFAARLLGLPSVGIDASPVATAISKAKMVAPHPESIVRLASRILRVAEPDPSPTGEFWEHAYHPKTLEQILRLRNGLTLVHGPTADALRGVVLGALHGQQMKSKDSYLSNQMPRTFASKPDYSVKFWKEQGYTARDVDVLAVIEERALRYYQETPNVVPGHVIAGDARTAPLRRVRFAATVTSPPYLGMNTYVTDQWLRYWFVGGPANPVYTRKDQIAGLSTEQFARDLATVWDRVAQRSLPDAMLIVRFGSIGHYPADPEEVLRNSLAKSEARWTVESVVKAGNADSGRRQALQMGEGVSNSTAKEEIDVVCRLM